MAKRYVGKKYSESFILFLTHLELENPDITDEKKIKIEEDIKKENPAAWDVLTKAWKYKPLTSEENEYYTGSRKFF